MSRVESVSVWYDQTKHNFNQMCFSLSLCVQEAMREADINKSRTLDFYEYLMVADKLFSKKGMVSSIVKKNNH